MNRRTFFFPAIATLLVSFVLSPIGCSGAVSATGSGGSSPASIAKSDVPRVPASSIPSEALKAAVTANNAFALDLYSHVLAQHGSGNLLTSPISASLALTMTYAGALGQTATEMAAALHFDPGASSSIFAGQNAISQALDARGAAALMASQQIVAQQNAMGFSQPAPLAEDYQLSVINAVWGEQTYTWQSPFLEILAANYGTGVHQQDFINSPEPARLVINDWVSAHTDDKIKDLLPPASLSTSTRLVLVNAIHLRFPWQTAFDASATAPASFTRADGTQVSTSFMNLTADFGYVDDGQAQIVSLPLSNGELAVVIALPHEGVDLARYEATLGATAAPLAQPSGSALVALSLPKTTFASPTFSLADALKAMGMPTAFSPSAANFDGMSQKPPHPELFVSDVFQKAFVAMQETGVEAAAATAVVIISEGSSGVGPPPPVVPMVVNRPYLLTIVDVPTQAVLFLGHIQDPTDSGGS